MTVIEHLREILAASIDEPLANVGIRLTDDRTGQTIAHYSGRTKDFNRMVTVVRDKWWSKTRGRFTIFLSVAKNVIDDGGTGYAEMPLGDLMGRDSSDWKIWASDDAARFVDELRDGIINHGIPWLERISEYDGFTQWLEYEGC